MAKDNVELAYDAIQAMDLDTFRSLAEAEFSLPDDDDVATEEIEGKFEDAERPGVMLGITEIAITLHKSK